MHIYRAPMQCDLTLIMLQNLVFAATFPGDEQCKCVLACVATPAGATRMQYVAWQAGDRQS